jgi:hypothetical protein
MGFKADTSFLRFLTMGALGVRKAIEQLGDIGFSPIELERYCASNKIWTTKVKRLRLPDLLCVRTGLRVEVRAKTDLKIRMSDAPANPDRVWDAGLRDEDLIAFLACIKDGEVLRTAQSAVFFSVGDIRDSVDTSTLGPPKSASEGAERDRTWPCTVPKRDGEVYRVESGRIYTVLDSGRRQTYQLKGKNPYVSVGDRFTGLESIIAGTVSSPVDPRDRLTDTWNPIDYLQSLIDIDRYAATKALPFFEDASRSTVVTSLESMIDNEPDERVALEMGASLARMDSSRGFDFILQKIENPIEPYIPMEAVFILTEIADSRSTSELVRIANSENYRKVEIRQAAVWGLGKAGARAYDQLIQFIDDDEDDVALHALVGFDANTPNDTIDELVRLLISGNQRQKAAICEILRLVGTEYVIEQLIQAARQETAEKGWIIAALGQLPPAAVGAALQNSSLLDQVQPFFHLSPQENWLAPDDKISDLRFLLDQNI